MRAAVKAVAADMASRDREELFAIRPAGDNAEDLVLDIAGAILSGVFLEGFVAFHDTGRLLEPVAVGAAWRSGLPHVADLAFFGREGYARDMPQIWRELARRSDGFGGRHNVSLAQTAVLKSHRAARRKMRASGGLEVFDYFGIGRDGQDYSHTIWRF